MKKLKAFFEDETGATAVEYAFLAALIGLGIVGAASALGNGLSDNLNNVANEF